MDKTSTEPIPSSGHSKAVVDNDEVLWTLSYGHKVIEPPDKVNKKSRARNQLSAYRSRYSYQTDPRGFSSNFPDTSIPPL